MKTSPSKSPKSYRLSFVINTVVGGLMLVLSALGFVLESLFENLASSLSWGFTTAAIICLFVGALHYSKYINLTR